MAVRVVIAEDSLLAREGITRVLERDDGIVIVGTCSNVATLRAAVEDTQPDVVVTDIRMPPSETDEGIRIADELRASHPHTAVVVLSQYAEPLYATTLFAAGSERRAYLLKERLKYPGELGRAIKEVAAGGSVVDPRVVETLLERRAQTEGSSLASLTPRERELLALIAQGHSNNAIAEILVLTKRAVEHHINNIFSKLDLGQEKDVNRRVKAAMTFLAETDA